MSNTTTCPVCSSPCTVDGDVTKHYVPVNEATLFAEWLYNKFMTYHPDELSDLYEIYKKERDGKRI